MTFLWTATSSDTGLHAPDFLAYSSVLFISLMLHSRNVLLKDLVAVCLDTSASASTCFSSTPHPIPISQCLRIERYRGLQCSTDSQSRQLRQQSPSDTVSTQHNPASLPLPLNISKLRSPPICGPVTSRRECRYISRSSKPPARTGAGTLSRSGRPGASSNKLLRGTGDGLGTLDNLELVNSNDKEGNQSHRGVRSTEQLDLHDGPVSKIQQDLKAEEVRSQARAERQAARRREREEQARNMEEEADYELRVRAPLRRLEASVSRFPWQMPEMRELLMEAWFGAKHEWLNTAIDESSRDREALGESLERWQDNIRTLRYAGERIEKLQMAKSVSNRPRFERLCYQVLHSAEDIGDMLDGDFLFKALKEVISQPPKNQAQLVDTDWLALFHQGILSFKTYTALSNMKCMAQDFFVDAIEIAASAHFLRAEKLYEDIEDSFPEHLRSNVAFSRPLPTIADQMNNAADSLRILVQPLLHRSVFGAWSHVALNPDSKTAKVNLQQKVHVNKENAQAISRLCRLLFHTDSPWAQTPKLERLVSAEPIFHHLERSVLFVERVAEVVTLHNRLQRLSTLNHAGKQPASLKDDMEDNLHDILDGEPDDTAEHTQPPEPSIGYALGQFAAKGFSKREHPSPIRTLESLKPFQRALAMENRQLRASAVTWRYWHLIRQMYMGDTTIRSSSVVSLPTKSQSDSPVASSRVLEWPTMVSAPPDPVNQNDKRWFYPRRQAIKIEYVCTELAATSAVDSLRTSDTVVIDMALVARDKESSRAQPPCISPENPRYLAVLVLATDQKIVIIDLQGQLMGMRLTYTLEDSLRDIFENNDIKKVGVNMGHASRFMAKRYASGIQNYHDVYTDHNLVAFDASGHDPNYESLSALGKSGLQLNIPPLPLQQHFPTGITGLPPVKPELDFYTHWALRAYAALHLHKLDGTRMLDRNSKEAPKQNLPPIHLPDLGPIHVDPLYGSGTRPGKSLGRSLSRSKYLDQLSLSMAQSIASEKGPRFDHRTRVARVNRVRRIQAFFLLTTFDESLADVSRALSLSNPYSAALTAAKEIERSFQPEHLKRLTMEAESMGLTKAKVTDKSLQDNAVALAEELGFKLTQLLEKVGHLRQYRKFNLGISRRDEQLGRSTFVTWAAVELEGGISASLAKQIPMKRVRQALKLSRGAFISDVVSVYNFLAANHAPISQSMTLTMMSAVSVYQSMIVNPAIANAYLDTKHTVLQKDGTLMDLSLAHCKSLEFALRKTFGAQKQAALPSPLATHAKQQDNAKSRDELQVTVNLSESKEEANDLLQQYAFLSPQIRERDEHINRTTLVTWLLLNKGPSDTAENVSNVREALSLSAGALVSDVMSAFTYLKANGAVIGNSMFAHVQKITSRYWWATFLGANSEQLYPTHLAYEVLQSDGTFMDVSDPGSSKQRDALNAVANISPLVNSARLAELEKEAADLLREHQFLSSQVRDRDEHTGRSTLLTWLLYANNFENGKQRLTSNQMFLAFSLNQGEMLSDIISGYHFLRANKVQLSRVLVRALSARLASHAARSSDPTVTDASDDLIKDVIGEDGNRIDHLSPWKAYKMNQAILLAAEEAGAIAKTSHIQARRLRRTQSTAIKAMCVSESLRGTAMTEVPSKTKKAESPRKARNVRQLEMAVTAAQSESLAIGSNPEDWFESLSGNLSTKARSVKTPAKTAVEDTSSEATRSKQAAIRDKPWYMIFGEHSAAVHEVSATSAGKEADKKSESREGEPTTASLVMSNTAHTLDPLLRSAASSQPITAKTLEVSSARVETQMVEQTAASQLVRKVASKGPYTEQSPERVDKGTARIQVSAATTPRRISKGGSKVGSRSPRILQSASKASIGRRVTSKISVTKQPNTVARQVKN